MSATDIVGTGVKLPSLKEVRCIDGKHRLICVTWNQGTARSGRVDRVDLSPLIDTYKFYRPLRDNPKLFATVHLSNGGTAVAWGENDEIDMASSSVFRLAEETMTADDFRSFLEKNGLTQESAAMLLGRSPRQLKYYLSAGILPRIVSLACIGLEAHGIKPRAQSTVGWMRVSYTLPPMQVTSNWKTTINPPTEPPSNEKRKVA
jgi:hypothetical protein